MGTTPYRGKTIEYFASGSRFIRELGLNGSVLHERAAEGDKESLAAFEAFGTDFGHALMTVLYAFDPEMVVIGGSVAKAYRFWETAMRTKLKSFAYPHALKRITITPSEEAHIAILGAAALLLDAEA